MDDLYRQYIIEHYREPRNHGHLDHPDYHAADTNPLCGDRLAFDLRLEPGSAGADRADGAAGAAGRDGRVAEVRFEGRGCAISQASASMLTEKIEGATLAELRALRPADILEMLGVTIGPARQRCALLSLRVLHQAIGGPYTGRMDSDDDDAGDEAEANAARPGPDEI